jgi:hypothetical protein
MYPGAIAGGDTGGASAWSPQLTATTRMVMRTERFSQDVGGGGTGHDNHGAVGHILKDHRRAFVDAIPRHHLGLRAEIVEEVCWGQGHSEL